MPTSCSDSQHDWPEQQRPSMLRHSMPSVRQEDNQETSRKAYSVSLSNLRKQSDFADYHFKPSPFYTRWVHGYNHKVGLINLNDNGSTILFYAASNFGILYNWTTHRMKILQGHRHMITSIASDLEGKWLVTADTGPENVVIVWDKDAFPSRTIFYPHRNMKTSKMALSGDAKYLLTLGYGKEGAQLHWWIWSYGSEIPHAKIDIPEITRDSILCMEFNPTNSHQFIMMTKNEIWIGVTEKIWVNERGVLKETEDYQIKVHSADKKSTIDVGKHTCFCIVKNTQVLVGTNRGIVVVYAYAMQYRPSADTTDYKHLRFIKRLLLEKHRINVIKYVDQLVVTGNGGGEIHFYDDQMKLLYWVHGFTVNSVRYLSFNVRPRSYMLLDPKCNMKCPCWEKVVVEKDPETGITKQKLIKKKVPTDVTKCGLPFLVRDFIVCCYKQGIGFVDFVTEKNDIILNYQVSPALALTVHPEKHIICVGYMNGLVELVNYSYHRVSARRELRDYYKIVVSPDDLSIHGDYKITIPRLSVTCLQYSPSGLHLACGLNTGQLVFLDPTTLDVLTPKAFKDTKHAIKQIVFSPDSMTLAFSDIGRTVGVYKYDCETMLWNFIGKHRAHYNDINSILFLPAKNPNGEYKLLSFGNDRIMAEYDIGESFNEYLEILSLDRMDQTGVPLVAIVWPEPENLDPETCHTRMPTVMVANDEHKYKIVNYETTMTLATYLGPRYEHPVRNMMLVHRKDETKTTSYLLFATKILVGLQKLPLDGNPWKHVAMLGHPNQIITLCFRNDYGNLFTIGARDNCVTQWQGNTRSVEKTSLLGGGDLDPYYCLVENGRPGWLFQEVRDMFYYIQILCQGTFSPAMRRVKDFIPIDSLPDLMRALGFFLTEYEVENMLIEAKYQIYNRKPRAEIDFEEFVKLYLNHRPAFLESNKKLRTAFKVFSETSTREGDFMRRDDFIDMLCSYGECFTRELAWYLLSILFGQSFEDRATAPEDDFSFMPSKIKFSDFVTNILGIPDFDNVSEQQSIGGASMASTQDYASEASDSDHGSFFNKIFYDI
ncbi:hypothetical protein O0L34_g6800 [Tuta absoluta]|nr:hypothetical protein O0L34_g6800 [Tuta absoluta]